MTQKEQILAHLRRGEPLTPWGALNLYGSFRLASVINVLKKEIGKDEYIETELIPNPNGNNKYAKYSLKTLKR